MLVGHSVNRVARARSHPRFKEVSDDDVRRWTLHFEREEVRVRLIDKARANVEHISQQLLQNGQPFTREVAHAFSRGLIAHELAYTAEDGSEYGRGEGYGSWLLANRRELVESLAAPIYTHLEECITRACHGGSLPGGC